MRKQHRAIGFLGLFIVFVCSFLVSSSSYAAAPTLSLTLSGNSIAMDIVALENTGTFASSNNLSISASTNNYSGYTLSISSSTNNAVLTGPLNTISGTNEVLNSIGTISGVTSSGISQNDYSSSSNTQYNDTWGYKPSKINSVSNTNFLPAPSTSGDIIEATSAANSVANDYTVSIGARVTPATEIGAYSNTFVVTAVANLISYSITYNANDGNSGQDTTNMPSLNPQTGNVDTTTTTVTLSSSTPTRDGYDFQGWCTAQVADGAACSGTEYQPGDSYTIDYIASNSFTLYARWELNACFGLESDLRCKVVSEWVAGGSRVQTNDDNTDTGIQAAITTANSGVFKYNSAVFGADSDATKQDGTKDDIYFFRGILDQTTGTYGSNGDGKAWPNYVVLSSASDSSGLTSSDTCWRIVRTTGSGGVKMIYNGTWTGSTCANATTNAQVITSRFNDDVASNGYTSLKQNNIHAVGYTYNNDVNDVTTASADTTIAKVLGSNDDYSMNDSDSIIKQYIEKTWFTNISTYQSILETSAGYCNDRSLYPNGSYTLADKVAETTQIVPSGTGVTNYYFGAYTRNMNTAQAPTLNCPRDTVDLYSVSGASTGNGQLTKPASLLTADELSFAGSGKNNTTSQVPAYNAKSFLRTGEYFWSLSPYERTSYGGQAYVFMSYQEGSLNSNNVYGTDGIRPAISLIEGTEVVSGTGIATNPWIVNPPPKTIANSDTMQDVEVCDDSVPANTTYSIMDGRDNQYYTVAKLADGKCWMTTNLNLAGGTELSSSNTDMDANWTLPTGSGFGSDNKLPASSSSFSYSQNEARLYNSGITTNCTSSNNESHECYSYYSWTTATLGSGNSINTDNTDAPYSICPKGWKLPNSRSTVAGNSDAYQLAVAYGMPDNVTSISSNASFYNNAGPNSAIPHFLFTGWFNGGPPLSPSNNGIGFYWTSTSWSTENQAYALYFSATSVDTKYSTNRRYGAPVRCVFKGE